MLTLDRTFYVPAGAVRVRHKATGGAAYLYTTARGRPAALIFKPKAQKPSFHHTYGNEAARERHVAQFFASLEAWAQMKAERKARRTAKSKLELGHVLVASWGYEQTNIDWYQVTRVISDAMVEVRKIGSNTIKDEAWMQGKCMPQIDAFTGEPLRRRVSYGDSVKIDSVRTAHLWDGRPRSWTAYH